jgi:hypothetical protein
MNGGHGESYSSFPAGEFLPPRTLDEPIKRFQYEHLAACCQEHLLYVLASNGEATAKGNFGISCLKCSCGRVNAQPL